MKKDDVEFHSENMFGSGVPAVNVKVYSSMRSVELPINLGGSRMPDETEITWHYTDPEFDLDWVEEHVSEADLGGLFEFTCSNGWEYLQMQAEEVWGSGVKVYSTGRSGGWAYVDGLIDFEYWDAIALGKWARFSKIAKLTADDVPYQMLTSIYLNDFEPWKSERGARVAELVHLHSIERGYAHAN